MKTYLEPKLVISLLVRDILTASEEQYDVTGNDIDWGKGW